METSFFPELYPLLIPPTGDRAKRRNNKRIYCNIPLRISLHHTGEGYNAARGNTKGGFVEHGLLV